MGIFTKGIISHWLWVQEKYFWFFLLFIFKKLKHVAWCIILWKVSNEKWLYLSLFKNNMFKQNENLILVGESSKISERQFIITYHKLNLKRNDIYMSSHQLNGRVLKLTRLGFSYMRPFLVNHFQGPPFHSVKK